MADDVATLSTHDEGVTLAGEIGFADAQRVMDEGRALWDQATGSVLDLSGLGQSNSVTVAIILSWYRHLAAKGQVLTCRNVPGELQRILDFTGLDEIWQN